MEAKSVYEVIAKVIANNNKETAYDAYGNEMTAINDVNNVPRMIYGSAYIRHSLIFDNLSSF